AMIHEQDWRPRYALGAELDPAVMLDCQKRFRGIDCIEFCLIPDLSADEHRGRFDTVVCMEVLEHVTNLDRLISQLDSPLSAEGRIAISVPVETGFPVFAKQTARRVAGWRRIGSYQYTSQYTGLEMLKSIFAGSAQHIVRPVYDHRNARPFHDHKGFNWRF